MGQINYSDKRVLIIDDQRPFLVMLRGILNNLGATSVVITQNADSALAACRKEKFDIIIADLHLGSGRKNGFQLLEELRVRKLLKPETLYMMVSADSERPVVLGSIEKQADDYLIKPFSQAQLNNRIAKAYTKKMALKPVYYKIMQDDINGAIKACQLLIQSGSRYRQICSVIMIELLWRTEQFGQAISILGPLLNQKRLPWTVVAMAKTRMYLNQFKEAMELTNEVLSNRKVIAVEAHDVMAQCYLKTEQLQEACDEIKKALDLSPYSLERQYLGCEIARANGDFEFAKNCCQAILDQTKKSVYRNIAHLCSYIRSILDAAEHAEEKHERNRYQQEALLALQRSKNDELLSRVNQAFDFAAFENIVVARMNVIEGKMLEAKRSLSSSQLQLAKYEDYPLSLAPDSIKVMYDLGEYEDAKLLVEKIEEQGHALDANTQFLLDSCQDNGEESRLLYNKYNKDGIGYYKEGKYEAAYKEFEKAQELAPMNTGVSLNLLQCLLKLLEKMAVPDYQLVKECKQVYRQVDGLHLPEAHAIKLNSLRDDLKKYIGS